MKRAEALIVAAGQSSPADTATVNRAMRELHDAIELNPHNDSAYVDLGFCYGLLRQGPDAVAAYRKATELNPSPANFKELADVYLRVADPEESLMAANAGLVKDPNNAELYNARGAALNDLERFPEAAQAFRKAVELDPTFTVARKNLEAIAPDLSRRVASKRSSSSAKPGRKPAISQVESAAARVTPPSGAGAQTTQPVVTSRASDSSAAAKKKNQKKKPAIDESLIE